MNPTAENCSNESREYQRKRAQRMEARERNGVSLGVRIKLFSRAKSNSKDEEQEMYTH